MYLSQDAAEKTEVPALSCIFDAEIGNIFKATSL
jgi:hypothetical protein